ncbi:ATP-binding protein [Pedobacter heparinus]|uniref:AlbA family DNA-binding domain-containing protein n=1 Tax=Pedobacter heparinus TaxID=984 RepID=UPI002931BFA1|nr:ATP-binding protein [Pedobacter heparinus]
MQSNQEILRQAYSYISQSMAGLEVENPKIDFKARWYKLTEQRGINEFIKDTSAIANSFGPGGMIIIGYDDKKKELAHAKFSDCCLKDSSQLPDLINKRIDRLFQFELIEGDILGFIVSIIYIPPSIDKPHVIRNYQTFDKVTEAIKSNDDHKIFIRRGSSTYPASKSDLELMYYDRKNVQPDYELLSTIPLPAFTLVLVPNTAGQNFLMADFNIIIENIGRRPVSISSVSFKLSLFDDPSDYEIIEFKSIAKYVVEPVILQSGELRNVHFQTETARKEPSFGLQRLSKELSEQLKHIKITAYRLTLSNGELINSSPKISC